jgi:predicted NBD/HSP70 family sugar kinase/biotin operon repressor
LTVNRICEKLLIRCSFYKQSTKRKIQVNTEPKIGQSALGQSRGTTQGGVRLYNERLALSLIRRYGQLPKAELARLTGLSAQTVSVIVRQLEKDGLLIRAEPVRGKVGQPLVPFQLNPNGGFSIGLKVGRRSGDLILLDLAGKIRHIVRQPYHFPTPQQFLDFAQSGMKDLLKDFTPAMCKRIAGLGIAAPFELWNWEEEVGAPHHVLEAWRDFDLMGEVAKLFDFPVIPCNDATAACAAELLFGEGQRTRDFAYFYVGYFIGGGLVLNGSLFQGRTGNAGALGSIPVPRAGGGSEQLIRAASFYTLEAAMQEAGIDPRFIWDDSQDWNSLGRLLDDWILRASRSMAHAIAAVSSIVECADVVIDGSMPPAVRARLVEATDKAMKNVNLSGITKFNLRQGAIGRDARALGAASLPLFANFIIDRDILFKEAA